MKKVFKYSMRLEDYPVIKGCRQGPILEFAKDPDGMPCVWILVDPEAEEITRQFRLAGTGHALAASVDNFCGTIHIRGMVFHLFEVGVTATTATGENYERR